MIRKKTEMEKLKHRDGNLPRGFLLCDNLCVSTNQGFSLPRWQYTAVAVCAPDSRPRFVLTKCCCKVLAVKRTVCVARAGSKALARKKIPSGESTRYFLVRETGIEPVR